MPERRARRAHGSRLDTNSSARFAGFFRDIWTICSFADLELKPVRDFADLHADYSLRISDVFEDFKPKM